MEEYGYAHFDTSKGERKSRTSHFNRPDICDELQELRSDAFRRSIPTADDETLCFILSFVAALKPKKFSNRHGCRHFGYRYAVRMSEGAYNHDREKRTVFQRSRKAISYVSGLI